jgi:hypothetical protein
MKSRGKVKTEDHTPCEKAKLLLEQAEQEIFGNISQCVCLAKLQIAQMEINKKEEAMAREACLLLGKAVKDLRNLARQLNSFQP